MSDKRLKLWDPLYVPVVLLLAAGALAVAWLSLKPQLMPWLSRWASESDPDVGPPPEAFERFRREQDDIARGGDRGPIRCTLAPWPDRAGGHPPDLRLELINGSDEPVTIWYYTWPHAHVTFLVRDGAGKIIAQFHWGTLSSQLVTLDPATGRPAGPVPTKTLHPGEAYTAGIYLGTLRDYLDVPPGRYRVEAVFVYDDLGGWPDGEQRFVARSGGVEVEVGVGESDGKVSIKE
jgi:hypothetical protein